VFVFYPRIRLIKYEESISKRQNKSQAEDMLENNLFGGEDLHA
jgi:hypothetical protein